MDDGRNPGDNPDIYFVQNEEECKDALSEITEDCERKGYSNIQLLTCNTLNGSVLKENIKSETLKNGRKQYPINYMQKIQGLGS